MAPSIGPGRKLFIQTMGCQMSFHDTDRIRQVLRGQYQLTEDPSEADLIIVNTCSVREKPFEKVHSALGRFVPFTKNGRRPLIGIAGCVAQHAGQELLDKVPYLNFAVGNDNIADLPVVLERLQGERQVLHTPFQKPGDYKFIDAEPEPEAKDCQAFVTVMKGCNHTCSYCIVPKTRGQEVSRPSEDVIAECKTLVAHGVKEITLLGQNVNSYGMYHIAGKAKGTELSFAQLLRAVDAQVVGLERLRFTTSNPQDLPDELIGCFGELSTLCEYFHLPLQSGSNRVLTAMRRFYTAEQFLKQVERLRAQCSDMALSTDVIVGFPGETEADFSETLSMLSLAQNDSIFSFKYSPRPHTTAVELPAAVSAEIAQERLERVMELQAGISLQRLTRYVGREHEVMILGESKAVRDPNTGSRQVFGRLRQHTVVNFNVPEDFDLQAWQGALIPVVVEEAHRNSLKGHAAFELTARPRRAA